MFIMICKWTLTAKLLWLAGSIGKNICMLGLTVTFCGLCHGCYNHCVCMHDMYAIICMNVAVTNDWLVSVCGIAAAKENVR